MNDTALRRAIKIVGTQSALAAALGVRSPSVSGWHKFGVPADKCAAIEALTGVRCEELRPDVEWTRAEAGHVTGYHVRVGVDLRREAEPPAHRSRAGWEEGRPSNESLVDDPVAAAPAAKVA